ncbi:hypothetical protein [Aquisalimonas sp.]|uniref:hypothetical protein n=1 Tax=Aquisalimonas sp. TaxID=1872621 RepID=UPI0025C5DE76|nr:hypothetical protein [Aquisalimonas sp.]
MTQHPAVIYGSLTLAAALLAGCASNGLDDETQERYRKAFGQEHEDWSDRPSLFRELFGKEDGAVSADEARIAELEAAVRELEGERSARTGERERAETDSPRPRVGLLLEGNSDALARAFREVSPDHPVVLLDDAATRTALEEADCDAQDLSACAESLALYPGLRTVLSVESRGQELSWSSYDVALDYAHTERTSELPTVDDNVPDGAYRAFADQALIATLDRLDAAPWHARAFAEEGDGWAINAGRDAGLEEGQELRVRGAPNTIRNPSDRPVAWRPGRLKGTVKVIEFAGDNVALVRLVDGEGPGEGDVLMVKDEDAT